MITIIIIALGLSMDAFAVSISSGLAIKRLKIGHALLVAFFFGSFQAIMPLVGWLAGIRLIGYISSVDHWIAFGLLGFIGCKMIYEALKVGGAKKLADPMDIRVLLLLSIATSMDALAVGASFAMLKMLIVFPVIVIGVVTFALSLLGTYIGNRFGHFFETKIEIFGGCVLIGIGIKILLQ